MSGVVTVHVVAGGLHIMSIMLCLSLHSTTGVASSPASVIVVRSGSPYVMECLAPWPSTVPTTLVSSTVALP